MKFLSKKLNMQRKFDEWGDLYNANSCPIKLTEKLLNGIYGIFLLMHRNGYKK